MIRSIMLGVATAGQRHIKLEHIMSISFVKRGLAAAGLFAAVIGGTAATTTAANAALCRGIAAGGWVNTNPATRGITRVYLARRCGARRAYLVKLYGKCHPTDCSWKSSFARYRGRGRGRGLFISHANHGFAKRRIVLRKIGNYLFVKVYTDFADPRRRDYVATYRFRRA